MSNAISSGTAPFEAIRRTHPDGSEFWSARDLMDPMGYPTWQHFGPVLERAQFAAANQGHEVRDLFTVAREKSGGRPREDVRLTRFAAYLVAMNGDPRKPEVAAAQSYFAIRTREAETNQVKPPTTLELIEIARTAELGRLAAEEKVRQLEPSAKAWGHMVDAAGTVSIADAAKLIANSGIPIGRQRLFDRMAEWKWIFRAGSRDREAWSAYQSQIECGRLVEKANRPFLNTKTGDYEVAAPTIRMTVKGVDEAYRRLTGGKGRLLAAAPQWEPGESDFSPAIGGDS